MNTMNHTSRPVPSMADSRARFPFGPRFSHSYATVGHRLMPPLSVPGVKPRVPGQGPPGGVDLMVHGLRKESSKSSLRKEILAMFGRCGKVQ